jgi:hypothetical protein
LGSSSLGADGLRAVELLQADAPISRANVKRTMLREGFWIELIFVMDPSHLGAQEPLARTIGRP